MKPQIFNKIKITLLLLIAFTLFFARESTAAVHSKTANPFVTATNYTLSGSYSAPAEKITRLKTEHHLSFFKRIKEVYKIRRSMQGYGDVSYGPISMALDGASLIAFCAAVVLATGSVTAGSAIVGGLFVLAGLAGIAGIILGALGIHNDRRRGLAIAGMVVGIVMTTYSFGAALLWLILVPAL